MLVRSLWTKQKHTLMEQTAGRTDGGKDGGKEGRGGRRHIIFLRLDFEFLLSGMDLKPKFLLNLDSTFLLNTPCPFNCTYYLQSFLLWCFPLWSSVPSLGESGGEGRGGEDVYVLGCESGWPSHSSPSSWFRDLAQRHKPDTKVSAKLGSLIF